MITVGMCMGLLAFFGYASIVFIVMMAYMSTQ